jgi:hypothetical protein
MQNDERIRRSEILIVAGLIAVFALIWVRVPEIKVSSKSLEAYNLANADSPSWTNNIGLTVTVKRATANADFSQYSKLLGEYDAYEVDIAIDGTNYPTMIDLPYERMRLTDSDGRAYSPLNRIVAAGATDTKLRQLLETFDWSIVNNTFTRQPRHEKGLLLFEPVAGASSGRVLHLNLYHHPYKQVDLNFPMP